MTTTPAPPAEPALPWSPSAGTWTDVECGEGWNRLLAELDADLRRLCPGYQVTQVKEKFGTLRFYIDLPEATSDAVREAVHTRIATAEAASATVCELCGAPGELRGRSWRVTLCDACTSRLPASR